MRPNEVLRWVLKASSPTKPETRALKNVIHSVAKNTQRAEVDTAMQQLLDAIEQFRSHFPYRTRKLKERSKISKTRQSLSQLLDALREASKHARTLPMDAKARIVRQANQPIGKLTRTLLQWEVAASETYVQVAKAKNLPGSDAPGVLAHDVAKVLSEILHGKVAMTSDYNSPGFSRGGAGYCRLLRATMLAAGATPPANLMPIMRQGKTLFDNPRGDVASKPE